MTKASVLRIGLNSVEYILSRVSLSRDNGFDYPQMIIFSFNLEKIWLKLRRSATGLKEWNAAIQNKQSTFWTGKSPDHWLNTQTDDQLRLELFNIMDVYDYTRLWQNK